MIEVLNTAIEAVHKSVGAYCHYITPNDVGATGSHQYGFTFAKPFYSLFFDTPGVKGEMKENFIRIHWQDDFYTDSRAIYYGQKSRNEYRITRFGRGFEFLREDYVGSLLVMTKGQDGEYYAYVLSEQDDIEYFILTFGLNITCGNQWINKDSGLSHEKRLENEINHIVETLSHFPETTQMSEFARQCYYNTIVGTERVKDIDRKLVEWCDIEYTMFGKLEDKLYRPLYSKGFNSCAELVELSNSLLNRRKSRAGKSLEHHLAATFTEEQIRFEEQVVTEVKKKPDFIFPDGASYHNLLFPADKLTMLGAKTTCKDRWRQVLNEADRIEEKHLFTLQQGVSKNQLAEMETEHLKLVVPKHNLQLFDREYHHNIMTLTDFVGMVRERQS